MTNDRDLPIHALRTFVAIVDAGGFTQAASRLGLTQPTVSQQLKKLEERVGHILIERGGRQPTLSARGMSLLEYARRLVDLNDEALASVTETAVTGTLRLGLPHEFTFTLLPRLVGSFSQIHPGVVVEVDCQLSKDLLANADRYDLVLALHTQHDDPSGLVLRQEPLSWAASPEFEFDPARKLLVAAAPMPCIYRQALQRVTRAFAPGWSLYLSSVNYGAICGAISTGVGVALLAQSVIPDHLRSVSLEGLPITETLQLRMHQLAAAPSATVTTFASFIQDRVAEK